MNSNLRNGKSIISFLAAKKKQDRQQQISDLDLYVEKRKAKQKKVLRFIKYWGASNKSHADKYDLDALMMLFGFLRIVEKHYKIDVHLTLIFTDTHVTLNGYSNECYRTYYKEISQTLNGFNYSHVTMSEVLMPFIKSHNLQDMNSLINSIVNESLQHDIPRFLVGRDSFERLKKSASKHSFRYYNNQLFGDLKFGSSEQAAYAYIKLNQIEKEYVEKNFFQSVFLTYTSDEEKEFIAPNLPTLQIYSYGKGIRSRPWFSNLKIDTK